MKTIVERGILLILLLLFYLKEILAFDLCGSGSRIQKMSIWIRILGGKDKRRKITQKTKSFKMTLKNH